MKLKFLLAALAAFLATPALADGIEIEHAYARIMTPVAKSGAVFLHIMNTTDLDDRLVGVRTDAATTAELHTHIFEDGVAKMREVEGGLPLPAHSALMLERGGDHVMLMGVTPGFHQGDTLTVTLIFAVAGEITLDVMVDNEAVPVPQHEDEHMHMNGMEHGN